MNLRKSMQQEMAHSTHSGRGYKVPDRVQGKQQSTRLILPAGRVSRPVVCWRDATMTLHVPQNIANICRENYK